MQQVEGHQFAGCRWKVFVLIVQERLQVRAEEILLDSQCDFQNKRRCTDMIFVARQTVEKCWEHPILLVWLITGNTTPNQPAALKQCATRCLFPLCGACWKPPNMLSIICSFHDGMQAEIGVRDTTTDKIEVLNGLHQGCTLALPSSTCTSVQ